MNVTTTRSKDEGFNPRVTCGFSRDTEGDIWSDHAPVGVNDPFTRSEEAPKKDVDFTSAF